MSEDFDHLKDEENLKDENEFLKMKLMLEQGAQFGNLPDSNLSSDIENQFLKNIIAFEEQAKDPKTIKVFDRIQRPDRFRPVNEIPDEEIETALEDLYKYLNRYSIDLSVCSPNISSRELYRFATEELFDYEMNDMNLPGMMTCFTYDEFHPDHIYDNARHAVDDCIKVILNKEHYNWMPLLKKDNLRINAHYPVSETEYINLINCFKEAYDDIYLQPIDEPVCTIEGDSCFVKGDYDARLTISSEEIIIKGEWLVEFELDEFGFWEIINVQLKGINI